MTLSGSTLSGSLLAVSSSNSGGSSASIFIFLLIAVAFLWVFTRYSSKKRANQLKSMVDSLSPGDEIVTIGGIVGYVKSVEGDTIHLEISDGVVIRVVKQAVGRTSAVPLHEESEEEEPEPEATGDDASTDDSGGTGDD